MADSIPVRVVSFDVGSTNMGVCVVDQCDPRYSLPSNTDSSASALALDGTSAIDVDMGTQCTEYPFRIVHWELIDLRGISTNNSIFNLCREFMLRPVLFDNVTDVVIESQEIAGPPIQRIAAGLYAHYVTRAMCTSQSPAIRVHIVSASNKFKAFKGELQLPKRMPKATHAFNKKRGICMAIQMLTQLGETDHLAWLKTLPKKDDVCDALLQAVWAVQSIESLKKSPSIIPPQLSTGSST